MTFSDNVSGIIDDIELNRPYDKAIIKHRFLDEITYYEKKRDETKRYYNTFRFIVTTGSILLPAVLSMGQMDPAKLPKNFDIISYWFSWTISLLVTGSNGFLQLFSLDKNYFNYSMVVEQLKTEGWQYFQLSGEYNYRETKQSNGKHYVSQDLYHINFIYRWFYSESWFFQNATNYRTDKLKGIDNELQNILGYGYRTTFFDTLELLVGAGVGFQDRSIVGLSEESPVILNVFQELNWQPLKRIKLNQTLNFFQNPQEMDIYNYEFILGINYRLTDLVGFEMRYFMDFDNGITESIKKDTRFQNAFIFYF